EFLVATPAPEIASNIAAGLDPGAGAPAPDPDPPEPEVTATEVEPEPDGRRSGPGPPSTGRPRARAHQAPPQSSPAGPPPPEVIATRSLTKVYASEHGKGNGLKAVDGLDLSVRRGEIFGLLGPNGAGKTTTVGMLTTRVIPTSGRAEVNGVDVVADPPLAKHFIGVVHQVNTLDRSLTAWENLYFHGRYYGMSAKAARQAA